MVNINSNSIEITESIKSHASKVLDKLHSHFHKDSAKISYSAEGHQFKAIIEYRSGKLSATASCIHDDLYQALTLAADKVEKQLRTQKEKHH
ncbi:ribosome hibernation-promoting factor, HPF/YfiA family [Vibrio splendidus]|nr:ribosome-associated translation inhibitor RaiA [Vibrio splendidus]MCC4881475.1 ribosome-associated translation inhibitor RaiA [Vibrio splendidus]